MAGYPLEITFRQMCVDGTALVVSQRVARYGSKFGVKSFRVAGYRSKSLVSRCWWDGPGGYRVARYRWKSLVGRDACWWDCAGSFRVARYRSESLVGRCVLVGLRWQLSGGSLPLEITCRQMRVGATALVVRDKSCSR